MNWQEQEIQDAYMDTCSWILEHESYIKWIENDRGILGIRGKPGSGKSTLLKKIFQVFSLDQSRKHTQLAYFYHRRGVAIQYSQIGMYRTLLYQLLSQVPSAGAYFWKLAGEKRKWQGSATSNWEWRLEELRLALSDALLNASRWNKVRIFADAPDEAGGKAAQEVVLYFREISKKLLKQNAFVSICFSCRYFPVITLKDGFEVHVDENNERDISTYISSQLEERLVFENRSEEEKRTLEFLQSDILDRAQNVFIWVAIVIPMVATQWNNGDSLLQVQKTLKTVPSDLKEIYRHILTVVIERSNLPKTLHLIQWIFLAEEPLSVTDIRYALAHDEKSLISGQNSCDLSNDFVESDERMTKLINSLTGGLAEVKTHKKNSLERESSVQFVHQSVIDFLEKDQFESFQLNTPFQNAIGQAHHRLSRSCFNFIKLSGVKWSGKYCTWNELKAIPFCEYSVRYCFSHAQHAEETGVLQTDLITQFEWPAYNKTFRDWLVAHEAIYAREDRPNITGGTLLHVASSWNLNSVVEELFKRGADSEECDRRGNTAMHYAARWGNESMILALLAANAAPGSKNTTDVTPLIYAASFGNESNVKVLLNFGEDINTLTKNGSALYQAAYRGRVSVVRLLLHMNAGVNAQGGEYGNALQAAVFMRKKEIVWLLLGAGADINAQGGKYGNALQAAASRRKNEIVQLLLGAGADVNVQGGQYGNALQAAAWEGCKETIQLLLEAGANVNAKGGKYDNALQAAAWRGCKGTMQLLLEAGADVNAKGGEYGNALNAAISNSKKETVQQLLAAGSDINIEECHCGNALQAAIRTLEDKQKSIAKAVGMRNSFAVASNKLQAAMSKDIVQLLLNAGARLPDPPSANTYFERTDSKFPDSE